MALTQGARNKIKSFVQAAKKLLMNEFESQLQQYYGIRPDGTCLLVEELTAREASVIETARLLRQRLHYLEESIAGQNKAQEAVRQLIREQAFTILNRFAAVRMSEERNIIRESIRKSYNSEGFQVYDELTGGAKTAEQFIRYKWYIGHVFDELAIDLPAVFDRFSPYALLFPSERVMIDLLAIINDEDLNIYRETGYQPLNLWTEDETIGWIYQYYNSREEISEMREASGAPRNSRELAVRNQFFTPRYVVQFLVDNSLGRQWYEMTKGKTALKDFCQYMVKQKMEIFLEKGEAIPEAKIEDAQYIEFRSLKDPREILMLDPACGSMHFGLYGFDLFEQIYIEAWDNYPELMRDLRDQYLREDFIKQIPGFILRHNIHGVDIDPRAIQIAGLSLWLRAQKSFDKLNIQPADRPSINKSNLVIAEPMPGDQHLLSEFTKNLPGPIGKLVRVIWEKMQLAGETGLLLKIEEELKKEIEIAKQEYEKFKSGTTQASLFGGKEEMKVAEMAAIYGKGQKITKDFFDTAEEEVLKALKSFAENAAGEDAFQKLLFAEDTARGFAFIELCRKRYDVIVMNPPFGSWSESTKNYSKIYGNASFDIYASFINRMMELAFKNTDIGCITSRSGFFIEKGEKWRLSIIEKLKFYIDFGFGVLDAMVEVGVYIIGGEVSKYLNTLDLREGKFSLETGIKEKKLQIKSKEIFKKIPKSPLAYWIDDTLIKIFNDKYYLPSTGWNAQIGLSTKDDFRFLRNIWEFKSINKYLPIAKGGEFSKFWLDIDVAVNFHENGKELNEYLSKKYPYLKGNTDWILHPESDYLNIGLTYTRRSSKGLSVRILQKGLMFSDMGRAIINKKFNEAELYFMLGYMNSQFIRNTLSLFTSNIYEGGTVNILPGLKYDSNNSVHAFISERSKRITKTIFKYSSTEEWSNTFTLPFLERLKSDNFEEAIHNLSKINEEDLNVVRKNYHEINKEISYLFNSQYYDTDEDYSWLPKINLENEVYKLISFWFGLYIKRFSSDEFESEIQLEYNFSKYVSKEEVDFVVFSENEFERNFSSFLFNHGISELFSHSVLSHLGFTSFYRLYLSNNFYDFHLKTYSRSRRKSPIYWLLGLPSSRFNIWIYYPKLNDGSLYKIINELVDPKIKEIAKEVEVLEFNGSAKELNDQKEFLAELYDFKEELLRTAQLPYKPNQDDGVLITAAPLHNLFRHTKWKKATEDCWKQLEKGEYDWAHLAYSIWPDRVRKKCKKDLSMAIAHGLEDICEVKPKEKKEKKSKEIKASSQLKLD